MEQLKQQYYDECKKHQLQPTLNPEENPREVYKKNFKCMIEEIFKPKEDIF